MKKLIVLNHKTFMEYEDVINYIKDVKDKIRTDIEVVICPSTVFIPYFSGKYNFLLGSQNISHKDITGEVTAKELKSLGVKYSIIGHNERKDNLNETEKLINEKIKVALKNNIIPIICLGETKEEYLRNKTGEVIVKQLKEYLKNINVSYDIVFAYEPNYKNDDIKNIKEIEEVITLIKNIIIKAFNINPIVLYGGNVNLNTIKELNKIKNLDGYLIGKESINVKNIVKLLNSVE